jgi:protein SCO1
MRRHRAVLAALAVALATHASVDPGPATAPRSEFVPPPPGSYRLQRIQPATDGVLLDEAGQSRHLAALTRGKITLLTFFYTHCADPLGCPFAYLLLNDLRARVLARPNLAGQVRFVSVSLDPGNDTPAAIARYSEPVLADPRFEWHFLTARSVAQLMPVLEGFGQDVSVETDRNGKPTRTVHHMLKVFLIDRHAMVREIYSLAYLQPEVMFNDLQTLVLEQPAR